MKAFRFRLEQALSWRRQSVLIEEARLAASGARVSAIRNAREDLARQAVAAVRELTAPGTAGAFYAYDGFLKASKRRAEVLAQQEQAAVADYAAGMTRLVEASRKARLLELIREENRRTWQSESDQELAEFAAEAFLIRQFAQRRSGTHRSGGSFNSGLADGTIEKRTGA